MIWNRFLECPDVFKMGDWWYIVYSDSFKANFGRKVKYKKAKSFEELNDARIKSLYESQYMRYCNDNVQMLQEYADEIDDVNEAKIILFTWKSRS